MQWSRSGYPNAVILAHRASVSNCFHPRRSTAIVESGHCVWLDSLCIDLDTYDV